MLVQLIYNPKVVNIGTDLIDFKIGNAYNAIPTKKAEYIDIIHPENGKTLTVFKDYFLEIIDDNQITRNKSLVGSTIENVKILNIDGAFRGMRNPMNSWDDSDSYWQCIDRSYNDYILETQKFIVGENDMRLATKLVLAGTDHSKFMRQIFVGMDISNPLYWWKEMDTYKVSTVANSTSTMHKLGSRHLVQTDFKWDKMNNFRKQTLIHLNLLIDDWKRAKGIEKEMIFRQMIQDLPDSYIQKRTWTANFQTLRSMYHARNNHKQYEWRDFCSKLEDLYLSNLITIK